MHAPLREQPAAVAQLTLLDLLFLYSNARDTYRVAVTLRGRQINADKEIKDLKEQVNELGNLITIAIVDHLCKSCLDLVDVVAEKGKESGLGNALAMVAPIIEESKKFKSKIFAHRVKNHVELVDDTGMDNQLLNLNWNDKKHQVATVLQANLTGKGEAVNEIGAVLVAFKSDQSLIALIVDDSKAQQLASAIQEGKTVIQIATNTKKFTKAVIEKYQLQPLTKIFSSVDEAIRVSQTIAKFKLTQDNIDHLGVLLREYMSLKNLDNSLIVTVVHCLNNINTIYDADIEDLKPLLKSDELAGKLDFISRRFKQASASVYKTYMASACVIMAKEDITEFLKEIIAIKRSQITPGMPEMILRGINKTIVEIEKFQACFEYYVQLTTRIQMPVAEIEKNCKALKCELDQVQSPENAKFRESMEKSIVDLSNYLNMLTSKTLGINELKDISNFIKRLSLLIDKKESTPIFGKAAPLYKPLFINLRSYLINITYSTSTEAFNNFQAIFNNVVLHFQSNKIDYQVLKRLKKPNEEQLLLIAIYERFQENVRKYQPEHSAQRLGH